MSRDQQRVRREFAALGGQLSNIVNRVRRNAVKNTTGGTSAGTSVKSTFGYLRWSSNNDADSAETEADNTGASELDTRLASDPSECERLDDGEDGGSEDASPSTDENSEHGAQDGEQKRGSCTSLDMPSEPATNTDTISEWQAGWNVTNAIQVRKQ